MKVLILSVNLVLSFSNFLCFKRE